MVKSSLQYKIQVLLFIFSLSFLLRDKNVVLTLLLSLADESLVEQLQTRTLHLGAKCSLGRIQDEQLQPVNTLKDL